MDFIGLDILEFQISHVSEFSDFKILYFSDFRIQEFQLTDPRVFGFHRFQNLSASDLTDFKIILVQISQISESYSFRFQILKLKFPQISKC